MRRMDRARKVHKDHISAVLDLDYSPTGQSFVTGAYDRSVRIYPTDGGHSSEIYHTKRMQRIFVVNWSADAKYILSGSDEMNIRLWKADASEHLGTKSARQQASYKYDKALKERFKHHPEIRRIARSVAILRLPSLCHCCPSRILAILVHHVETKATSANHQVELGLRAPQASPCAQRNLLSTKAKA